MLKFYSILIFSAVCISCSQRIGEKAPPFTRFYSNAVNDTFSIFISLPEDYHSNPAGEGPIGYKGETYSNLDHMDMPLPGFVKGMQWILNK